MTVNIIYNSNKLRKVNFSYFYNQPILNERETETIFHCEAHVFLIFILNIFIFFSQNVFKIKSERYVRRKKNLLNKSCTIAAPCIHIRSIWLLFSEGEKYCLRSSYTPFSKYYFGSIFMHKYYTFIPLLYIYARRVIVLFWSVFFMVIHCTLYGYSTLQFHW